jgi:hypothetical protein
MLINATINRYVTLLTYLSGAILKIIVPIIETGKTYNPEDNTLIPNESEGLNIAMNPNVSRYQNITGRNNPDTAKIQDVFIFVK